MWSPPAAEATCSPMLLLTLIAAAALLLLLLFRPGAAAAAVRRLCSSSVLAQPPAAQPLEGAVAAAASPVSKDSPLMNIDLSRTLARAADEQQRSASAGGRTPLYASPVGAHSNVVSIKVGGESSIGRAEAPRPLCVTPYRAPPLYSRRWCKRIRPHPGCCAAPAGGGAQPALPLRAGPAAPGAAGAAQGASGGGCGCQGCHGLPGCRGCWR